ncbi:MAG TPA: hypothetical protein VF541_02755 [Longimicrobium sp.]|jgi:hypothetical protein
MPDRDQPTWPPDSAGGKRRFIIRRGVLGWAVPTGILVTLTLFVVIPVFMVHDQPDFAYLRSRAFQSLLAALVLWPLGGWLFGAMEWRRHRRRSPKHSG